MGDKDNNQDLTARNTANIRLVIILSLVAVGLYAGYILLVWL